LAESFRLEQDEDLVKPERFKKEALTVAQRLARAEAELGRRGPSRFNDQNEPSFEVMVRLLALVCKLMSPKAQLETCASNVWQDRVVQAPDVFEVQLNRLRFAPRAKLV
jgi:hypothetical protein